LHVHDDVSHHARTIVFAVVGRPIRLPCLRPLLAPQPAAPAHGRSREPTEAHRHGYGASRSCSWPFSVRAVEEDMVAPATLLAMRSPGLRYWTTKTRSVTAVGICYGVGGGVVSLRGSRAGKTLTFSRPSRTDAWCGCLLVWSCSG
jgi:hypothetical protein